MKEKDNFQQIEDYLAGRLPPSALRAFHSRMESEPEFAEQVREQKATHDVVDLYSKIQLKEKVKSIHSNVKRESDWTLKRLVSIAAGISILIVFSGIWIANANYSNQSLVADNYQLPSLNLRATGNTNTDSIFRRVETAYKKNNYDLAISLLATIPPSVNYNTAQFYLGNLYLETQQSSDAIEVFKSLLDIEDQRYLEDVHWLLVLAYIQNDESEQAKIWLDKILSNPDHSLYEKAVTLKKKLNSFWRKIVL